MTTRSSSEEDRVSPANVVQQSIIQQAQAAAAAQTASTASTQQQDLLQKSGRDTPNMAEDDTPPPAYGEIYGEVRNEKNGLGTLARVTDDGRVNIRINQLNRRLSQIFTPALRQQVEGIEEGHLPPPPYIPPSLGGDEGVPPPPPLNIVIQVVGSRGDVQPFVALGRVLKGTYGHRVRLATHPNFKDFVQENGLEFFSIGGDPSRLMAFMVKNPSLMPGFRSLLSGDVGQRRKDVAEYIQGCWRSCYQAGDGMAGDGELSETSENETGSEHAARPFVADCIIANPPSFAHIHCAEKLGIPLHVMFTMPYSPTQAFPHPLANIQSSNADPQLTNYISYAMIEVLLWQGLGDIINRFRAKCLGLDPVSRVWAPGMLHRLKVPHTYCWSPALISKPKDWGPHISIAGFYLLNSNADYSPSADLQAFLGAGPPPVYIGFGSIVLDDPNAMTQLIFEAVRKTGQRVLLSKGWGGVGADEFRIPDNIFLLGNVPHDWLFKHVSCVVHHGGAGTTAAGTIAGRPTVVVPFFGDQPFWGAIVARAGAGPNPIPSKQLTADNLADAINFCLRPGTMKRAKELATKIAAERGSDMGAQSFHQYLEVDRLRCTLAPSRTAVWRLKRTQVRLSTFAACTLANADLLAFHDLKLFRAREYDTDEGPWDPISGFTATFLGSISNIAMGVADFPSETWKALRIPIESSRKRSSESVPTIASTSKTLHVRARSSLPASPGQSQTSLDVQELPAHTRSSSTTDFGPSPISNALQHQLGFQQDSAGPSQVHNRSESGSSKHPDMMRQTGVHTRKGFGRIVTTTIKAPMDLSMSLTKGFHNLPKIWGDDTVRPQEQVSGLKSATTAMGKEFGFGFYDGVTGLFTQPWKGARKAGAGGFFKGIGKGVGGFVAKPGAALFSIPSYMMKGVHKEVQKLFGTNVQNYIVASRTAQGYEEWLQSSDAEKQDVIMRWKLIQKYLKKKHTSDEMLQDILEAQRNTDTEAGKASQVSAQAASSAQFTSSDAQVLDPETVVFVTGDSESSKGSAGEAGIDESSYEMSYGDVEEHTDIDQMAHGPESQSHYRQQEAATDDESHQEDLRRAIAASEVETRRQVSEALEYEEQLKQVMARSLREQRRDGPSK